MKKILILSLLISCSQFFMSCENWFDVNPKSQVKNDILFENENGYKTALFGIYTTMATPALYGQELTMSLLDVLAQYYTINDNYHNFYNASIYNYEASTVKSKFDAIGKTMYKTIMNCNTDPGRNFRPASLSAFRSATHVCTVFYRRCKCSGYPLCRPGYAHSFPPADQYGRYRKNSARL